MPDPLVDVSAASRFGPVTLTLSARGLVAVGLGRPSAPHPTLDPHDARRRGWVAAVLARLARPDARDSLPLDLRGTPFQRRVWQALIDTRPGQRLTYAGLGRQLGLGTAARAVAGACAANPCMVVVPCHRVVRADGSLGGYRWGVARKERLLAEEAALGPPPRAPS